MAVFVDASGIVGDEVVGKFGIVIPRKVGVVVIDPRVENSDLDLFFGFESFLK